MSTHLDHLIHQHGRTRRELDGLPLAALHRLEHVEQALDLIALDHQHVDDEFTGDLRAVGPREQSR